MERNTVRLVEKVEKRSEEKMINTKHIKSQIIKMLFISSSKLSIPRSFSLLIT